MLVLGAVGCKSTAPVVAADPTDPANVNMATVPSGPAGNQPARALGQRDEAYPTQSGVQYPQTQGYDNQVNAGQEALEEADQAPPPLPEYAQPQATRANTIWAPGYWRHAQTGYYWVPGAWVTPPYAGALWTPGYWGADGQRFRFHQGYWGRHVGFYGGVNYGGGYVGTGYRGGYWNGNQFYYNQAFYQVDPNIREVYNQPWRGTNAYGRVSYNGGVGGIGIVPIAAEVIALHEQHERPIRYQYDVERQAQMNRGQFYEYNRGRPEAYFAGEGFVVGIGGGRPEPQPVIVQRPIVIDERGGFPGRGNAFGHDKDRERGNPHDDRGRDDDHDRGGKHDR